MEPSPVNSFDRKLLNSILFWGLLLIIRFSFVLFKLLLIISNNKVFLITVSNAYPFKLKPLDIFGISFVLCINLLISFFSSSLDNFVGLYFNLVEIIFLPIPKCVMLLIKSLCSFINLFVNAV